MGSLVEGIEGCAGEHGFLCAEHEGARVVAGRFPVDDDLPAVDAGFGDGHPFSVDIDEHPSGQLRGSNRVRWVVEAVDVAGRVVGFLDYRRWGRAELFGVVGQVGSQDALPLEAGRSSRWTVANGVYPAAATSRH